MKHILSKLKNPKIIRKIAIILICLAVIAGTIFYLKIESRIFIENSVVSAPITPISPATPGKLKNILVIEGEKVKRGDALAVVGSEVLRSYSDGIVIEVNRQFGSLISAQNPPVKLISLNDMRIEGTIDESKGLNRIKVGQTVSFTIDALPGKTFWGYVDEVAPSAKQTQVAFSISSERPTQQFEIFARFDIGSYPEIKNGMSAKMIIFTKL